MVLSLRAMISQFVVLTLIAAFCFGGFLYALWTYVFHHYPSWYKPLTYESPYRLSRNEAG